MEIINRKARFNYLIEDTYEAGIVLSGTEIKAIRMGNANLQDSYGLIRNNEGYLLNMFIGAYKEGNQFNHDERRTRKLLLHKSEISKIINKVEREGYTLIPLKLYFVRNRVKVELALAKGKKLYDKRETIKKRDIDRELKRTIKNNN